MPLATIVAGCDLSVPGDLAVDRAVELAVAHGARLVLVHAQDDGTEAAGDPALLEKIGEVSQAIRVEAARHLADRLAAIQARGVAAEVASRPGPAGEIVAAVAAEHDADLIVVGTHGHTGIARILLGSVATSTLRHAPCDVLVVRGDAHAPFRKPLVAVDFSPAATRALAHAAEVTAAGVEIHAVHAWQLPTGSWGATLLGQARFPWSTVRDAVLSSVQAQSDKLVAAQASRLAGRKLVVDLVQGPASTAVTDQAAAGGHDLIAIGTHGHRGFRRLLLGSVAENVVNHAPCSVLVVHGEHAGETARFAKV
jgi:nucleotide-binding universal stress UspA family protein